MAEPESTLFSGCRIAFVPSSTLKPSTIAEATKIVLRNGGEVLEPESNGKLAVHEATHIVSDTIDFEEYTAAGECLVPVVTCNWITNSLMKRKLAALRPHSPDPRLIFHAVNVTCADLPPTDKESIIGATIALGGTESKDLTKLTTHICALSYDHPKVALAVSKGLKCKVVLPHWFDDCFKLGKRIDEGPYQLPDPEILKAGESTKDIAVPCSQHLEGATTTMPTTAPENTKSRPASVFNHRTIKLSVDLPLNERFLAIIRAHITKGGGKITDDVEECDIYICHYREGDDYIYAAQKKKHVGNIAWLLYLVTHDEWTSPLRRLLHYPVPRGGIPGFEGCKITVSNYGGEARTYLENLIRACGAEFTKTMKQDNTHLITARNSSEKCEAALDWNVTMVNHLWIEESYAKCEMQHPSNNKKYTTFPQRTNLSEVIGQTSLDETILREVYYPGGEDVVSEAGSDTASEQENEVEAGEEIAEVAVPVRAKPAAKGKKSPLSKADNSNKAALATPARSTRSGGSGKENVTPASRPSTSRSAKSTALNKLHVLAPDIALYEKEKKRMSNGPFGGKRAASELEKQQAEAAEKEKEKKDAAQDDEDGERPAKRQRSSRPPVQYRICLTGWKRWLAPDVKSVSQEDKERRKLRQMGINIVQEGQPCDYLAAPRVVRTQKFLTTLARGPELISDQFLVDALENGELPNVEDYPLEDANYPDIQKSIARARQNKGKLLRSVPIYCTAEVPHGPNAFKAIAEANGAIFKIYRARSGVTIRPTTAEEDGGAPPDPVYLLSGDTAAEKLLWPKFEHMAREGHMEPRIVDPDWLLDVAMRQRLDFDEKFMVRLRDQ
ncbi:hypothetical protein MCOR27_004127 [Pyricularia oryzae]|uniref:BRCT domain-containing protein n=2 Tax=Pyricularia TaxID=48558 RepID=A0ABQ8NUA0_PYRGI|nr:hypothetical protein MCOR01_007019 [Pyricularia oryzae]KAI6301717.1 hypothetical protein MCOR33_002852 [Pyricularia grisea]KAH9434408.1 hypothetical protein MCOR02_006416 [Pyricularia oryzae]KAI6254140.1 hypothetical protein MCOR19_009344 [Pyricularia oryzae]KAI6279962.1 hypothetical protein MCOR26_003931 [Pyricularia oryzae]